MKVTVVFVVKDKRAADELIQHLMEYYDVVSFHVEPATRLERRATRVE